MNFAKVSLYENQTVITNGLFRISRNPVFLGMIVSMICLVMVTPNTVTLLFCVVSYILIQIQIRLEEEFLKDQHGKVYIEYQQKTRRFI
ncbi:MAG: DUF1295 domain-containing protein [Flavobacteriaceae bacterium]|nr:MAG: DUF1295 domain-containing protein [Flavobacteriaceae bacterium]